LDHLEKQFKGITTQNKTWFSAFSDRAYDVGIRIIERLQFLLTNVHVRVEVENKFGFGFKIEQIELGSCCNGD